MTGSSERRERGIVFHVDAAQATGKVAIDPRHLGTPWDVVVPAEERNIVHFKAAMKRYADACTGRDQPDVVDPAKRPLAVVQLVHAGRQSMRGSGRGITEPALAPSAVPMSTMGGLGPISRFLDHMLWGPVQAMTTEQVQQLRDRFVQAALICAEAGFDGVRQGEDVDDGVLGAAMLVRQRANGRQAAARGIGALGDLAADQFHQCPGQGEGRGWGHG